MNFFKKPRGFTPSFSFVANKKQQVKDVSAVRKLKPGARDPHRLTVEDRNADFQAPVVRYSQEKCLHHDESGKRCLNRAVMDSLYCKDHGGNLYKVPKLEEKSLHNAFSGSAFSTKYDDNFHPTEFVNLALTGMSDIEIATEFGISKSTMDAWGAKYPNFKEALDIGRTAYEAYYLRVGRRNFTNDRFNNSLFKFLAMNKLNYSDKVESKSMTLNQHGVLLLPPKMTIEEWENQNKLMEGEVSGDGAKDAIIQG